MRVLIADKVVDQARVRLAAAGCEVHCEPGLREDALSRALRTHRPDVLVVRSTRVQAAQLDAAANLSLVVRAGAGVNTIDVQECARRGIYVANCPGRNALAVAELTMGLLLAIDRRIPDNVAALREGRWDKATFSQATGLHGRRMALLGFGRIGQAVAERALSFGLEVIAWSRSLEPERAERHGVLYAPTPEAAASDADVLSVHLAATPATEGFVSSSLLQAIRPGGVFLNTSRARVVDSAALLVALDSRELWAGLDVLPEEPGSKTGSYAHPLGSHPRVYGTHHIGASTQQAQLAVGEAVCEIIEAYQATGEVRSCVNLAERTDADHAVVVRHQDRVGVLAAVLDALRQEGINVQEMDNTVFAGGEAAVARIHVQGRPSHRVVEQLLARAEVLSAAVVVPDSTGGG